MNIKKDILYNITFISIISIYSIEVCPHVSKLGLILTGTSFFAILLPLFILRMWISKSTRNSKKMFLINFTHFLVAGIIVGLFNYLYRSFPIESALKMITGALCLGVLNSIIYALEEPFVKTKQRISFINRTSFFLALILI